MAVSAVNRIESDDESFELISNQEYVLEEDDDVDDVRTEGSNDVIVFPPAANVTVGGQAPTMLVASAASDENRPSQVSLPLDEAPRQNDNSDALPDSEARRLAIDTLLNPRPRSNPRSRTPRRNPSPLAPSWNRTNVHEGDPPEQDHNRCEASATRFSSPLFAAGQRLGGTVGGVGGGGGGAAGGGAGAFMRLGLTTAPAAAAEGARPSTTPIRERPSLGPSPSSMPSKRKVRRWNNDNFVGVAAELAQHSKGGAALAELFLKSEAEKAAYLFPNYPLNYRSEFANMARNKDGKYSSMRERFFGQCEVPQPQVSMGDPSKNQFYDDGHAMFLQLEPRLRKVLVRFCHSSKDACRLVTAVERFIVHHLSSPDTPVDKDLQDELKSILLEPPVIQTRSSSSRKSSSDGATKRSLRFAFDSTSPHGAFHRLLFHIICQFHGLESKSQQGATLAASEARILTVSGRCCGPSFYIVDYALGQDTKETAGETQKSTEPRRHNRGGKKTERI